jgi:hypothetical protein
VSVSGQNLLAPYHVEFGRTPGPSVGISRGVYVELRWRRPDTQP